MAYIGNSCIYIGSTEWGIGSDATDGETVPVAVLASNAITGVVNAPIVLDASRSFSDDDDILYFEWTIESSPLGSTVAIVGEGDIVRVVPDLVGAYIISVVARGAKSGCSDPATVTVNITNALLAWSQKSYVDYSWIWQLLPDFWSLVPNADRAKIENFWDGIGQIVGSDLLGLYNIDVNKSISTIQDRVLHRWLKLDPTLPLEPSSFVLNMPQDVDIVSDGSNSCTLSAYPPIVGDVSIPCVFTGVRTITPESSLQSDAQRTIYVEFDGRRTEHVITGIVDGVWSVHPSLPFRDYPTNGFCTLKTSDATDVFYSEGLVERISRRDGLAVRLTNSIDSETGSFFCVLKTTQDLIGAGVSVGDVLVSKISDIEETISILVHSEIVAVTPTRVLFRPSLADGKWLTDENLASAKAAFFKNLDLRDRQLRNFQQIFERSASFKRRYFNTDLTAQDVIYVGDLSFRLSPSHIIRNTKIRLPDDVLSVLTLDEFITPVTVQDGKIHSEYGATLDIGRDQVSLRENNDFLVTSFEYYGGGLAAPAGSTTITSDTADFELHDVIPGDVLNILSGTSTGKYIIKEVDGNTLVVDRAVPRELVEDDFRITREKPANFIRFTTSFSAEFPCPILWAETYVMDNGKAVQANFGEAVKLTKEEHTEWSSGNTYQAVVAAMLRVKMLGPNFSTFVRSISTALGLPTSAVTGVIRNIEHSILANNTKGRIVIEDLTPGGEPTGFYRVYTFKEATDESLRNLAGLSSNPSTGLPWQVGDVVLEGEVLSNGVLVEDRSTSKDFPVSGVLAYHVFRVLLDVDSLRASDAGLNYIVNFIREARPHYIWVVTALLKYLVDYINIESEVFFSLRASLFDDAYHINFGSNIFDEYLQGFQRFDSANAMTRSIWRSGDLQIREDGIVFSATGGFLNGPEHTDFGSSSPVAVDDLLLIPYGPYKSVCTITEVIDDNTLRTNSTLFVVNDDTTHNFEVIRETLGVRAVQFTTDGETLNFLDSTEDLRSSDVGPGDLVQILDNYHVVTEVDLDQDRLTISPPMPLPDTTVDTVVVRPCVRATTLFEGNVTVVDGKILMFARRYGVLAGDTVVCNGIEYPITALDVDGNVFTYPKILDGAYNIKVKGTLNSDDLDALDRTVRQIEEMVVFKFLGASASIVGNYVAFGGGFSLADYPVKVGDIIHILAESIDVGEGAGVLRVVDIDAGGVYTNYAFPSPKPSSFALWRHTPGWIREI
jgi:hypothetical protein